LSKEIIVNPKLISEMFPWLLKIFFLILILCGTFYAQTELHNQIERADQLFRNDNYFDAITEYKRFLFFSSDNNLIFETNYKIGLCYKAGAKFDDAIRYFSIAEKNADTAEKIFLTRTEIIRSNILRKTFGRALQLCKELEIEPKFFSKRDEIYYWRAWAFMLADDWENAANTFSLIDQSHELRTLCDRVQNEKVSVTFAKVISYILPGAGQFYSGEFLSGLMSFGWNFLAGYLTVNSFLAERAFDGVVTAELFWLRFYRGNVQNAEKFAVEKNVEVANRALRYLQNEYKGIKP
jgi:tetratricopeptide (TPR) repeat protein